MGTKKIKIAVTGATGFIGRYVIAELLTHSVDVIAVVREMRFADFSQNENLNVVELDIKNTTNNSYEEMGCPDALIHLAWDGLPNYKSLHHFKHELPAHYNFLESMVNNGLSSLFVAGTCFEYGMQSDSLHEDMKAQPNNPYGFAKNTLYCQLEYLKEVKPFSLTWGRLFYLYGDGQSEQSLQTQLLKAIKKNDKVFNMSGGKQLRDYLPVSVVANYIVSLSLMKKDIGVINICSGEPISVCDLVEVWIAENNWDIKLNLGYFPYPDYEPMAFWGDREKLDRHMKLL